MKPILIPLIYSLLATSCTGIIKIHENELGQEIDVEIDTSVDASELSKLLPEKK